MSDSLAKFKSEFTGDVVTAEHSEYAASIARWAANAARRAAVVAFVKSPADVALAIAYARKNGLPLAIRGGGHSPAGASSIEGGLVIDLSRYLNTVKIDPEGKQAYVGGGALWSQVDKEAIKHGLATVAGTVNHTGVGGLTVGGGWGWLSGRHGLVIDNLIKATVVTADGSILTASADSNPDLFFGIRGGGSNFGVVTEFVYRLHEQRVTVYAGLVIFAADALERIIDVTKEWWSNAGQDEAMIKLLTVDPNSGNPVVICVPFYNGPESEGRKKFKKLLDIGPLMDLSKEIPYEQLNALLNDMVVHNLGAYIRAAGQHAPHFPSLKEAQGFVNDFYKQHHPDPQGFLGNVLFEYFPTAKVASVQQGLSAFRRESTMNIVTLVVWKPTTKKGEDLGQGERANTAIARKWAHEVLKIIRKGQDGLTETQWLGYSNHDPAGAAGEPENVDRKAKDIFGGNYPKLQEIKKKYDPEEVFNKWFPITPA